MDHSLYTFLTRFITGKISPEEYQRLCSRIRNSSSGRLYEAIEAIWQEQQEVQSMPPATKIKVYENLRKEIRPRTYTRWLRIASIIILPLLLISGAHWIIKQNRLTTLPGMVIMAEAGQKTHLVLPDGTKVWINSQSSLTYPSGFSNKYRKVTLQGEAYFEVPPGTPGTFIVQAGEIQVIVHGTKFNIRAFSDDSFIRVSLLEGSISVLDKTDHTLAKLVPSQTMQIDKKDLSFRILQENTHLTALWSQYKCKVENATPQEVFKTISYWYGMDITIENPEKNDYRYGFTIKGESIREFLELINELTPLEYNINGEEVKVRYK